MNKDNLEFVTFCVGNLADALNKSAHQVYEMLRSTGILAEYIIPCYDVLHTFSRQYIVEDLIEQLKKKGAIA